MKKIMIILIIFFMNSPLYAFEGIVISHPDAIIYESPFGMERGTIPAGTEFEIESSEHLFTRISYKGITSYIANAQYMRRDYYNDRISRLKEESMKNTMVEISVSREIPFYSLKEKKIIRYIEPGWILPLIGEEFDYYRVKFIDLEGFVLKSDTNIISGERAKNLQLIKTPHNEIIEVDFKIFKEENMVYSFFLAVLKYFRKDFENKVLKTKFKYTKEDLTIKDFKDLFLSLGIKARINNTGPAFSIIESEFKNSSLILFKLRIEKKLRYYLMIKYDSEYIKLLDIFMIKGYQYKLRDFLKIYIENPKFLIIFRE